MRMSSRASTWATITVASYVVASLAAASAVEVPHLLLPSSADASNTPSPVLLHDPFVRAVATTYALLGGTAMLPAALWALQRTDLKKSIPRVGLATVACAAITGFSVCLAVPVTFLVGLFSLINARYNAELRRDGIYPADPTDGASRRR